MNKLKSCAVLLAVTLQAAALLQAEEIGIVKKNRVNVRGQASQSSEVITQLQKGESVVILEEVATKKPKRGEPTRWARIQLPPNTPVWVFAPYVEPANKTVNSRRLNVRGGPGENFSILGRLERGATVKEIRTVNNWMEIEPPTNSFAFVALDLLEKQAPVTPPIASTTTPPSSAPATPTATPTTVEPVTTEPPPVRPADPAVTTTTPPETTTTPATQPATPTATSTEPVAPAPEPPAEPPRRLVSREGIVIISRSIQSPTSYALESLETKRTINYIHSEDPAIKFKLFAGRKVIVSGEELLDQRWAHTPIIEVETIRLSP